MATIEEIHKEVIYPVVRVRYGQVGGSGTILYSKPHNGKHQTFVLTNGHVVKDAVTFETVWDDWMKKDRKVEKRNFVSVEMFRYNNLSIEAGATAMPAEIVAYTSPDETDLALLRLLDEERPAEYVAKLLPAPTNYPPVFMSSDVYAAGCALGHSTIFTSGQVMSLNDRDAGGQMFWMSTAPVVFGNSGGAVFLAEGHQFIGVPSRVSVVGWGSPITHMGYFIPYTAVYRWLKDKLFHFIYDQSVTLEQCEEERRKREGQARQGLEKERHEVTDERG